MIGTGKTMITGVDHVQITIPPGTEEEARAFYCRLLGLREIEKPTSLQGHGGLWLQVGGRQVHIGVEEGVNRRATKAHVAYAVSDLERWRAVLSAQGIKILEGVPIPGYERFEFRDPFGNRVEFIQSVDRLLE
jgi:catechol 2,3-dioxygenase-like lactoylglutathione lyase family enzyme